MKLNVHVGTEKTGSSHLQTVAALGRDQLSRYGVHFPTGWAHDERSMGAGRISAGNARPLAQALTAGGSEGVEKSLIRMLEGAKRASAERVLLTSEWLLPALEEPGRLAVFDDAVRARGVTSVDYLVLLRAPVDQCVSLYKHRAKRGTAGDIVQWCEDGYRLGQELAGFRAQAESLGVDLTVRGYSRSPGVLEQCFFKDWLGVRVPEVDVPATVNPSLTLSELGLIRQMAETRPALVEALYDALIAVDSKDKVQGQALETYARAVAAQTVAEYADEWQAWNRLLPADEQLEIPERPAELPPRPDEIAFTATQLDAIARVLGRAATPRFLGELFWQRRLRPMLGAIRRAFLGRF